MDRAQAKNDALSPLEKVKTPGKHFNAGMTDRAKKIYRYWAQKLISTKRLTEIDLPNLVALANSWDQYLWSLEAMAEKNGERMGAGYMQKFKSGATNITTEYSIMEKSLDQITKLSKIFGLSFRDRHAIASFFDDVDPNQTNLLDELMSDKDVKLEVVNGD